MNREHWLNGWPKLVGDGKTPATAVLIGTAVHCIGCGKFGGVTTVAFSDDWKAPEKRPDWPFEEKNCPVCYLIEAFRREESSFRGSFAEYEKRVREKT